MGVSGSDRTEGSAPPHTPTSVLAAVILLLGVACDGGGLDAGPLRPPDAEAPSENYSEFRAGTGRPFTFGLVFIKNHGDDPVVLDSIELIDGTDGIEVVGLRAADITGDRHTWSSDDDFPPARPRDLEPLQGYEIEPNGGQVVQILLGLQLTSPGQHGFRSVAIHYHVGDRDYRYVYPSGVVACSHDIEPKSGCDARLLFPAES